jgi:CBS-domain-containing membrane protein
LPDLETRMSEAKVTRLPILDDGGRVVGIVHGSLIAQFNAPGAGPAPAPGAAATLGTLMLHPQLGEKVTRIGFVGRDRSLRDAKAAMNAQAGCKDVFVTATGDAKEPIVGWVTDTRILLALDA